jgi:hypothetical protein
MENRSREAFSLLFPNEVSPDIIRGKDRIYKFSKLVDNEHIKSISRLSGKFAYYIELDGDKIIKEYDLLKGKRIA